MELRLLRYFLTVAKEQSFTKAAEQLHITQPTLSRQMAAFEEELGVTLFIRSGKKISLTEEGILLKRRALEILNLEEKTLEELKGKEDVVEGNITIGCGEFAAVETLAEICKTYKEKYPLVQIVLHTATADAVYEMMKADLDWMNKKSRSSVEMSDKKYRPEIMKKKMDMSSYDEILLGFPIWWYVAPTIVNTFLEAYDFSGKKIVLFATSGGSGFGNTVKELQPSAPDAVITEGSLLNRGTKQEISEWVKSL